MPRTEVRLFQNARGECPISAWLHDLETRERIAYEKCLSAILALSSQGNQLRRPTADYLRDGIHELRVRKGRVNYRILYGFFAQHAAVLLHGLTKEDKVAPKDIDVAVNRLALVVKDPDLYTQQNEV